MEVTTNDLLKTVITVLLSVVLWLLWSRRSQRLDYRSTNHEGFHQVSNITTEDRSEHLTMNLKKMYCSLKVQSLKLMMTNITHDFIDLTMLSVSKDSTEARQITKEELFLPFTEEMKPSRILINGTTGCGKTSLAYRLAYDWAQDEPYMQYFDIVLVLPINNLQVDSLTEVILEVAEIGAKEDEEYLYAILQDKTKHSLIVLDGFDQFTPDLLSLVRADVLHHVTVLMTSRWEKVISSVRKHELDSADNGCTLPSIINFFDKTITIEVMSSDQQAALVTNILSKVPVRLTATIKSMLEELVPIEFRQSPMFLSMAIAIFFSQIQNIKTEVDFYKHLFMFTVQRYLNELGIRSTNSPLLVTNVFTYDAENKPFYVPMINQLGQISCYALEQKKGYISAESVVELNVDWRILDLGFFNLSLTNDGFHEKVQYKPIHNSVFELAAAYSLWLSYSDEVLEVWQHKVCCLRPRRESPEKSLVFPVLANLLEGNACALFQAIQAYHLEYNMWFGSLLPTFIEILITPATLASISPVLPVEWQVPTWDTFAMSSWHSSLIQWGVSIDTIKLLTWNPKYNASFPDNTCVETMVLYVEGPIVTSFKKGFPCKNLWCFCENSKISYTDWQSFLTVLKVIPFERIAFHLTLDVPASSLLSHFHTAFLMGQLRHVKIDWLKVCMSVEKQSRWIPLLIDLIQKEKIKGLHVIFKSGDEPTTPCSEISFFRGEYCLSDEKDKAFQEQINKLVLCVGKSTYLTGFIISNSSHQQNPIVEWNCLIEQCQKSWELIQLHNVILKCKNDTQPTLNRIQYLDITNTDVLQSAFALFCNTQVTSFVCNYALLVETTDLGQFFNNVSELGLRLDDSILEQAIVIPLAVHIQNLQIFSLFLTSELGHSLPFPVAELLFGSFSYLQLTGLEIWSAELNPLLCIELVQVTIQWLQGITSGSSCSKHGCEQAASCACEPKKLQLEYFLLHSDLNLDIDNPSTISVEDNENLLRFISVAQLLKPLLMRKLLPKLFITCLDVVSRYMSKTRPNRIGSWCDIFPTDEGFIVKHDLLGMTAHDSIRSKAVYVMAFGLYKRFYVTTGE